MINHYSLYRDSKIARVTFVTIDSYNQVMDLFEELFNDLRFTHSDMSILVDLSHYENLDLELPDIEKLILFFAANQRHIDKRRFAILAPDDLAFGVARMWELMKDLEIHMDSCVFRDQAIALDWLYPETRSTA